jgi:hypothetical protein
MHAAILSSAVFADQTQIPEQSHQEEIIVSKQDVMASGHLSEGEAVS